MITFISRLALNEKEKKRKKEEEEEEIRASCERSSVTHHGKRKS